MHTFGGWFADSGLTAAWGFASDAVSGNTTLYAKWDPVGSIASGTVRNDAGSPLAGASVSYSIGSSAPSAVQTDASGRYEIFVPNGSLLTIHSVSLRGHSPHPLNYYPSSVAVPPGGAVYDLRMDRDLYTVAIQAEPGTELEYSADGGATWNTAVADGSGNAAIPDQIPYGEPLHVRVPPKEGHSTEWSYHPPGSAQPRSETGDLLVLPVHDDMSVTLSFIPLPEASGLPSLIAAAAILLASIMLILILSGARYRVHGMVLFEGRGLEGAEVSYEASGAAGRAAADGNGMYAIRAPAGAEISITAVEAEGFECMDALPKTFFLEKTSRIEFRMRRL
jgi:uncharacterized repeat protein (TIGR02543 family)